MTSPRSGQSRPVNVNARLPWPLLLFFVLACAGSWICWNVAGAAAPASPQVAEALDLVGSYGPALAALVVTARATGITRGRSLRGAAIAVGVLAVSIWVLSGSWHSALGAAQPGWAVAGLLAATALPAGVTWLLVPATPDRVNTSETTAPDAGVPRTLPNRLGWIGLGLILFPVTSVIGLAVVGLFSGSGITLAGGTAWPTGATTLLGVFAATALYGGPLGEEPGWRGFALPRLQAVLSPLLASVVVGISWAAWHLPLQLRGAYEESMSLGVWGVVTRFASQVAVSVIFTWIFNRSGGSLLVVVILHTSLNNTAGYWLPNNIGFQVGVGLLATLLVLVETMGFHGPPRQHPRRSRHPKDSAGRP
jgi:membrane protease YdiL (CAAX protease family)